MLDTHHWLNMSEPPPPETMAESAMQQDDQPPESQLSEGILNALRQLQESSLPPAVASTPTPTSTQPNSQDPPRPTSVPAPEPTPPPQSEWDQMRAQLREKPVDADGWQKLVDLAEDSGDIEKIKDTYEGMLETYPNTVRTPRVLLLREYRRLTRVCSPPFKSPTSDIFWTTHPILATLNSSSRSFC